MTRPEIITDALVKLSKHRVGVKEAAILFLCHHGTTALAASLHTGQERMQTAATLTALKRKRLIKAPVYSPEGKAVYYPTPAGLRIIEAVTNPNPTNQ